MHRIAHRIFLLCLLLAAPISHDAFADPLSSAPSFNGTTLTGEEFTFSPGQLQKPALAVFWASWCQECRYEFHELKKLYGDTVGRLDIYGITVDSDIDKAIDIATRAALPYLSVFDPEAQIAALFDVRATPTLILIDQHGNIRHVGHRINQQLKLALSETLN